MNLVDKSQIAKIINYSAYKYDSKYKSSKYKRNNDKYKLGNDTKERKRDKKEYYKSKGDDFKEPSKYVPTSSEYRKYKDQK